MAALTMDEDGLVELILSDMTPRPANYEDIIATNLGRKDVDDDERCRGPDPLAGGTAADTAVARETIHGGVYAAGGPS